MRLLNDLLNIHDGFDDEGWLKECKKHMVDSFQERIYLVFLFQQEKKLTRYASNIHFICPLSLVELHDSYNQHVSCRTQESFVTTPPPLLSSPFFLEYLDFMLQSQLYDLRFVSTQWCLFFQSLMSSTNQVHGTSWFALWLPIDLFLKDAIDKSQEAATSAVEIFPDRSRSLYISASILIYLEWMILEFFQQHY